MLQYQGTRRYFNMKFISITLLGALLCVTVSKSIHIFFLWKYSYSFVYLNVDCKCISSWWPFDKIYWVWLSECSCREGKVFNQSDSWAIATYSLQQSVWTCWEKYQHFKQTIFKLFGWECSQQESRVGAVL